MRKIVLCLVSTLTIGCMPSSSSEEDSTNATNCPPNCENSASPVCAQNQTLSCACAGGTSGVQVCAENRQGWTPCGCEQCSSASDCRGGSLCMAGVCIQNECGSDDDCAPDQSCIERNCRSAVVGQYSISGTVTAASNGRPLNGARVSIRGSSIFDTTDSNGGYSLPSLSEGNYTLTATMTCYDDFAAEVALFGANRTFDIELGGSGCSASCPCADDERCETRACVPRCVCEYPNECNNGRTMWEDNDECINAVWTDPDTDMHWFQAYSGEWKNEYFCDDLIRDGVSNWHWATISDLRTLVRGCPATQSRGSCSTTDDNPVMEDQGSWLGCRGCPNGDGPTDGLYIKDIGWADMPDEVVNSSTNPIVNGRISESYISLAFRTGVILLSANRFGWDGRFCIAE